MTAGDRLVALARAGGIAGALLLSIGSGVTAAAALVNYSGLVTGTAAQHLLTDRAVRAPAGGGKLSASKRNRLTYVEQDGKIYLFEKPSHAADWIAQQNAISEQQRPATPTAKKRKVKGPVEVIRIAEVRQLARRYDYPSVPRLIEEKDLSALVAIYHKLIELQDEEDVEMLLMAAAI